MGIGSGLNYVAPGSGLAMPYPQLGLQRGNCRGVLDGASEQDGYMYVPVIGIDANYHKCHFKILLLIKYVIDSKSMSFIRRTWCP